MHELGSDLYLRCNPWPSKTGRVTYVRDQHVKGITGSERSVIYPGDYHYFTRANMYATETGTPLMVLKTCQASASSLSQTAPSCLLLCLP